MPFITKIRWNLTISKWVKCHSHTWTLCETFLNDDILNNELQVKGFKFERKDRNNNNGGGLIVYIKDDLSYKRRLDIESVEIESIGLEFNPPHSKPLITSFIYRPPNSLGSWIDLFEKQVAGASTENQDCFF